MPRLEVVRMVADWLISDINTRIQALPLDDPDDLPPVIPAYTNTLYPNTTIAVFDETRHPWVMKRESPEVTPALYVMSNGIISMKGEPYPSGQIRDSAVPVPIAVRYIARQAADLAHAIAEADYTLRAVARSLRELSLNSHDAATGTDHDSDRLRNGIFIELGEGPMQFYPVLESLGQSQIAGALVVNYKVRDQNPSY